MVMMDVTNCMGLFHTFKIQKTCLILFIVYVGLMSIMYIQLMKIFKRSNSGQTDRLCGVEADTRRKG